MLKRKRRIRPKVGKCPFCEEKINPDWKNIENLQKYFSERGKILGKVRTAVCARHQRKLSHAVKRARYLSLLPFVTQVR